MKTNRIENVNGGRFFSHHDHGITYFDSRHRVTKTKLEGGMLAELVEELQPEDIFTSSDWPKRSYRYQLETVNGSGGGSVIDFDLELDTEKRNRRGPVTLSKDVGRSRMNMTSLLTNASDPSLSSLNGNLSMRSPATSLVKAGSVKDKWRTLWVTARRWLGDLLTPASAGDGASRCPVSVAFTPSGPLVYQWGTTV
jgi:hypothetical protein